MENEAFAIAFRVGRALQALEADFHLGGSLASSIHGIPRATLDADLVADLKSGQGRRLYELLGGEFYADPEAMEEAIRRRSSFNVIHLGTLLKVDIFVLKDSPFDRESFRRSRPEAIGTEGALFRVATPEDMILHKLIWYRTGGEVAARQWGDILGVLKVQAGRLDKEYLARWARELGVEDLLRKAVEESSAESTGPPA